VREAPLRPPRKDVRRAHVPSPTLGVGEVLAAIVWPLDIEAAEQRVAELVGTGHAVLFSSARGALAAAVATLPPGRVAVPAYTCIAVPNAVVSARRTPSYVDVDGLGLVPAHGWPDDAAVVVAQDTYGFRADVPSDRVVVRDASHRADLLTDNGATVCVTSFEHSKWLSAGQGGVAVTDDPALAIELRRWRDSHSQPAGRITHGLITLLILALGRAAYAGRRTTVRVLRRATRSLAPERLAGQSQEELTATGVDPELLGRPNDTVARLVTTQLRRGRRVAEHRAKIVGIYDREAGIPRPAEPLIRYPMRVDDPAAFERELADAGWDVSGRWFNAPLHPGAADAEAFRFDAERASNAVALSRTVVNLPTHTLVSETDAMTLVRLALDAGACPLA
jgi:perosamine synthetase